MTYPRRFYDRFQPDDRRAVPLFLDTSALYAYYYDRDECHSDARQFFTAIRDNELRYRPLVTNDYVVDELLTLLSRHKSHEYASTVLENLIESSFIRSTQIDKATLERAKSNFQQAGERSEYQVSFTDHVISAHMVELEIDWIYSYDGDFDRMVENRMVVPFSEPRSGE